MKRFALFFALSALFLTSFNSCKNEEEDLFDQTSALRLEAAKKDYTALLTSASNGWVMEYFATEKYKGYTMLVKFNSDGSVKFAARDDLTSNKYTEEEGSLWEMISDNGPVLTFNTSNSLLHRFSSPEDIPSTSKDDEQGLGYEGDYEFIMVSPTTNKDAVMLKGKKRGMYIPLTRLSEDQNWEDYFAKQEALKEKVFGESINPVLLALGDKNYEIHEINSGMAKYIPEGGDIITDAEERSVAFTSNGFRLIKPITENDHSVQNFVYDENNDIFTCTDDQEASIRGVAKFQFIWQQLTLSEKPKSLTFNASSEMSSKFSAVFQPIVESFKEIKYSVTSFAFIPNGTDLSLKLTVRTNKGGALSGNYYYTTKGNNDELNITYKDADATGNNLLKFNVEPFVKTTMSREFELAADKSNMNLETIKLVDKNDPELWVIATLK